MSNKATLFKRIGAVAASLVLVVTSFAVSVSADTQNAETTILTATELQLVEAIDTAYMQEQVAYVHNNIGPRFVGTPADESSAQYFAAAFDQLGYTPFSPATAQDGVDDYFETIADNSTVNKYIGGSVTINGREYTALAPLWNDNSVYKGYTTPSVTGETVYFEYVDDAVAADADDIAGKIVLTNRKDLSDWPRNGTEYADAVRALEAKGALAVVFFHSKYTVSANGKTSREYEFPAPTTGEDIHIPVVLTPYLDGRDIIASLTCHDRVESTTATVVNRRNTHTSNILAVKKAETSSDKYVLLGAHRDSVFGAEGVNDNLSGVVSVLAIAKALQDIPTDHNVIFALWGAEEHGLIGSKYFYSEFLVPDNWGKDHIVAYYNLDMAATSQTRNSVLTIHTPFRDENGDPLQSPAGDVAQAQAERYWAYADGAYGSWWTKGLNDVIVDLQYFGNCSDHAAISGATGANGTEKLAFGEGIPSVYMFWGDRLGDATNFVTEQNYHVVGDIYEWPEEEDDFIVIGDKANFTGNYSIERAQILTSVFALSVYNTAAAPVRDIADGATYYGDTDLEVAYTYRDHIILDGEAVTPDDNGVLTIPADNAEHTLSLTDVFGQTVTYTVSVYKTYTVVFEADGRVVSEVTVHHGEALTDIPAIPAKAGYDQTAPVWSITDFDTITSDLTVTAVYTKNAAAPDPNGSQTTPPASDAPQRTEESDNAAADREQGAPHTGEDSLPAVCIALLLISGGGILAGTAGKKILAAPRSK